MSNYAGWVQAFEESDQWDPVPTEDVDADANFVYESKNFNRAQAAVTDDAIELSLGEGYDREEIWGEKHQDRAKLGEVGRKYADNILHAEYLEEGGARVPLYDDVTTDEIEDTVAALANMPTDLVFRIRDGHSMTAEDFRERADQYAEDMAAE